MTKWADYVVTGVKYSAGDLHIQSVKVWEHEDGKLVRSQELTRPQVVSLIDKGKTFITATKNNEGKFTKGAPLQVIKVETRFLKTNADKSEKDNLEHLPSV